jgi:hypothetical protein
MHFRSLLLAGLFSAARAAAGAEQAFPESGAPYPAVYRWGAANKVGGAKANEDYARWLNLPAVWAEDFPPIETWDHIEGGGWQLGEWSQWKKAGPGRRFVFSVPLLPGPWDRSGPQFGSDAKKPVSLTAGARGDYNAHFRKLAENLVKYGLADSILRLGWEWNGGWYAWRARDDPKSFAGYWREIVKTMRVVPGTEKLRYCWNPTIGWIGHPVEDAWPGDEFVDYVGLDVYDQSYLKDTYPWPTNATPAEITVRQHKVWEQVILHGEKGLAYWKKFSDQHGKPLAIPEWGVHNPKDKHGGGDNPYFIEQMHKFINNPANRVYFHCYFDVQAGDGHHQLSPGIHGNETNEFPRSAAKFKELFGLTK